MKAFKDIELTREEIENLIKEKKERLTHLEKGNEYIKELSDIALLQIEINQFDEAEENLQLCINHFKNIRDRLGESSVYGILGILNFKKEKYEPSIQFYKKALNIYNELNQKQEVIMCLKGIGSSRIKLGDLDKAAEVFLECSEMCSKENDIFGLLDCLGNLISIYEKKENWDIVLELYKKALKAFEQIKDWKGMITSYFNIGIIFKKDSKYGKALEFFKKGTNIAIEANFAEFIIRGLSYVAESLFFTGKIKEAKHQYIKALAVAKKTQAKNAILQIKIMLKSLGLSEEQIDADLREYQTNRTEE
jgi:tetratricopeptide (TPR) repeat protein